MSAETLPTPAQPVTDNGGSLTVDGPLTDAQLRATAVPVSGTVAVTGSATSALQTSTEALIGAVDETAPATDTASSGLNGRLQRIAQRLTSLIALVPTSLGQKTKAASFAVVLASDQDALPVTDNSGTLTVDAPVGTPVFVRLSDGAAAISALPVSLASVPSHAVTNAGTFATQDSEKIADNAGFTDGTTKVMPAGYIYDETAGTALSENDIGAPRINANRATVAAIEDGATRARYATVSAANALKVDGSAVTQPVSLAASTTGPQKAEDVASADADIGIPAMAVRKATPANTSGTDGDYEMIQMSAGRLWVSATVDAALPAGTAAIGKLAANSGVDIGDVDVTSLPALPAGTNNIGDVDIASALPAGANAIGKLAANSGVDIGDVDVASIAAGDNNIGNVDVVTLPASTNTLEVVGDAAHDAAAAGNPVLVGGYASAAAPTGVSADADAVRAWFLRNGATATVLTAAGALIGGDAANGLDVDITRMAALVAGTANIGDVDVLTLPAIPAGTNNIGDVDVLSTVLPVPAATGTVTSVADAATSATLLSSSATRLGFRIFNDSTEKLYIKYGTTASATDFTVMILPQGYLEENFYYGRVDGIWAANASGSARITSLS